MKLETLLLAGGALRLALLLWGEAQDRLLDVKYTDIDYKVFTDAARLVAEGHSPYERSTYRYSPLLAYIMLPNIWLHSCWGKALFSVADMLVAWLMAVYLRRQALADKHVLAAVGLWLFNPFTFTISTRGSCDVLVVLMLQVVLLALLLDRTFIAAVIYGLAVHFRIYPIIYAPSVVLHLAYAQDKAAYQIKGQSSATANSLSLAVTSIPSAISVLQKGLSFGLVSGTTFFLLNIASYAQYGHAFLQEAFLYHMTRRDPRHNFSPYFYPIYLYSYSTEELEGGSGLDVAAWAFGPTAVLLVLLAVRFHRILPLCWLLQTMVFVAFNKVVTAQYFVWYYSLLPLVLPYMEWPLSQRLKRALVLWALTQIHWLAWAYLLEFQGQPVHMFVWAAGLLFLGANAHLIVQLIRSCTAQGAEDATRAESDKKVQ